MVYVGTAAVDSLDRRQTARSSNTPKDRKGSFYPSTKYLAQEIVRSGRKVPGVVVNPGHVWGTNSNFVTQARNMLERGMFVWMDHGEYPYPIVHVDNLCHGLILAGESGRHERI